MEAVPTTTSSLKIQDYRLFRFLKNWLNTHRFQAENSPQYCNKKAVPTEQWALNASVTTHQKTPFNTDRFQQLKAQFTPTAFNTFMPPLTTWAGLESLQTLEWLSIFRHHEAFPALTEKPIRWLDVGSKNFAYAPALALLLTQLTAANQHWQLKGIELDAGRLDNKGITRTQYATGLTNTLPNTLFQQGDILNETQPYEGISLFLPFVFEDPLLKWGLPSQQFKPLEILAHCIGLLTMGGVLLIINLTPEEAVQQEQLFQQLPESLKQQITWVQLAPTLPNSFINWQYERIAWLCIKHPTVTTLTQPD